LFIWYLLQILGELKKNVTRQTWRALFPFGEYLFQSTRHFGECLKKMVSYTGPYVKLSSAVVAILVEVLKCRTQFWKRTTQESLQQSLVEIGSVVSEEKIFFKFHPPFFLICIIGQNRQKFIKNPVIYVKKLIIMLIQFKFGHILA
jgi:hypothetical protein